MIRIKAFQRKTMRFKRCEESLQLFRKLFKYVDKAAETLLETNKVEIVDLVVLSSMFPVELLISTDQRRFLVDLLR